LLRESIKAAKAILQKGLPDIRGFDGCRDATLHVNKDDDLNLLFVEHWASREHFERYRAWRAERGDHTRLVAMLTAPLMVRFFEVLR
jgi:quinol monooxygenase YgiN